MLVDKHLLFDHLSADIGETIFFKRLKRFACKASHERAEERHVIVGNMQVAFELPTMCMIRIPNSKRALMKQDWLMADIRRFPRQRQQTIRANKDTRVFVLSSLNKLVVSKFGKAREIISQLGHGAISTSVLVNHRNRLVIGKHFEKPVTRLSPESLVKQRVEIRSAKN